MDNRDPFQFLMVSLHCEVPGLGKPKVALFAFAMSLVASKRSRWYERHSERPTVRKPKRKCQETIWRTKLRPSIARWRSTFRQKSGKGGGSWEQKEMASLLTEIARQVNMAELHRNQRGPKKPPDKKPVYSRKHKHFDLPPD